MVNPSNSNFIKFQDNFNIGYILLGNEIEREKYICNYFNKEIERVKYYNRSLFNEQFFLMKKRTNIKNSKFIRKKIFKII